MRRLAALAVFLPLLGCGTSDPAVLAISCPDAAVLAQAATVTKFRPGGTAAANVIVAATMQQPQLSCDYDEDDNRVRVNASIPITINSGAAAANAGVQTLSYFVAVIDPAGTMLSKRVFNRAVQPGGVISITENVNGTTLQLPMGRRPFEYQFLTGFQLTPEELAYNQTQRNFRP